jgi:hypothetical protein
MKHFVGPAWPPIGWRCLEASTRRIGERRPCGEEILRAQSRYAWLIASVKLFYTGPVVNAEMLVVMLEKHGIIASQEFVEPALPDDGDLSRPAKVLVPETDYDRAWRLFYAERQDEL